MDDKIFDKMDRMFSARMKNEAPHVPGEILNGFSHSVAERIRERENQKLQSARQSPVFRPRVLVPVFAAVMLFFTVIFRVPSFSTDTGMRAMVAQSALEISEEITALSAMGAWGDEDDNMLVPAEIVFEDLA